MSKAKLIQVGNDITNKMIKEELSKGRKIYKVIGPEYKIDTICKSNKQHFTQIDNKIVSIEEKDFEALNSFMKIDDCKLIPLNS